MFLTAVIFIIYFSLSDLAKWMNQNGATDKQKLFVCWRYICSYSNNR